ncbi:unnamed protein product [Symbiodinium sp. CCMP2592]|nr:unnamed protein product [Symbiodinium sp. CCMP2592]
MQVQSSAEVGCIEVQVLRSHLIFVLSHVPACLYDFTSRILPSPPKGQKESGQDEDGMAPFFGLNDIYKLSHSWVMFRGPRLASQYEARAKYKGMCQEIFGSGPVDVEDSSEEEFDRGTFADALQQRNFLSPLIQVSRPEIMLNNMSGSGESAAGSGAGAGWGKGGFEGDADAEELRRQNAAEYGSSLLEVCRNEGIVARELYKPITKKNKLEQWYDFVTQAELDMENIKTEEEMSERVRYIRGFDKFGSEWRLRYAPPPAVCCKSIASAIS